MINSNKLLSTQYAFYNCKNLKSIDLSSFNFSSVTISNYMFYSCINLEALSLPNKMFSLKSAKNMFDSCSNLKSIKVFWKIIIILKMHIECFLIVQI